MRVREIMNKAFVVDDNIKVKEAARIMSNKNIGSLIVMKKNKVVGILTERDILKSIEKPGASVGTVMTKNMVFVDPNENLENAAELMTSNKIRRLPVIEKGELIGIVTATDLIANSDFLGESFLFE